MSNPWDWAISPFEAQHADRLALIREVHFETSRTIASPCKAPTTFGTVTVPVEVLTTPLASLDGPLSLPDVSKAVTTK